MLERDIEKVLVTKEQIQEKTKELGQQIARDYEGKNPLVIGILKGAIPFMADLVREMDIHLEMDFMDVSSYTGTTSTRDIRILKDLDRSIKGINILLVEDIVDTGHTLKAITSLLNNKGANDIKTVSLLDKPSRREVEINADFVGFEIPNEFVIGIGLDFDEKYRQLPYIGILKDELYQ